MAENRDFNRAEICNGCKRFSFPKRTCIGGCKNGKTVAEKTALPTSLTTADGFVAVFRPSNCMGKVTRDKKEEEAS